MSAIIDFVQNNEKFITLLISTMNLLTTVCYVIVTYKILNENKNTNINTLNQLQMQHEHWANSEKMKYEITTLLEMKALIHEALWSINNFFPRLMIDHNITDLRIDEIQPPKTIKFSEYLDNYDKIYNIYDLYNKNILLFSKHELHKFIMYMSAILSTHGWLSGKDFTFTMISETENSKIFKMTESDKIINLFCTHIYYEMTKDYGENFQTEAIKNKNTYIQDLFTCTYSTVKNLESITTYTRGSDIAYPCKFTTFPSAKSLSISLENYNNSL